MAKILAKQLCFQVLWNLYLHHPHHVRCLAASVNSVTDPLMDFHQMWGQFLLKSFDWPGEVLTASSSHNFCFNFYAYQFLFFPFSNLLFQSKLLSKSSKIKINPRLKQLNKIPPQIHEIWGSDLCKLANSLLLWPNAGDDGRRTPQKTAKMAVKTWIQVFSKRWFVWFS